MKKLVASIFILAATVSLVTACQNTGADAKKFDPQNEVNVIAREGGSGTRGAFIELFGIEKKSADGSKTDRTTEEAIVTNKTDVMLTNIVNDVNAIGYVSLGSVNDTIQVVAIDGTLASAESVKNGTYTISRPFNIATKGEPSAVASDFIRFILSKEGQDVVAKSYIPVDDVADSFKSEKPQGKIVVAGSSSVTPIMEKLKEAYALHNENATVEIQMSDSTSGMTGAMDGTCDIGMASRSLKDSEIAKLMPIQIALDGICVIVNKNNPTDTLTKEQVKKIYTGEITKWSELNDNN